MGRLALRERQRQLREDVILQAAHSLIAEQGYTEMNMDELATRAGVSKATLYQHFPSKEEVAINVIVRAMRRGEEAIGAHDSSLPAAVRLERALRFGIEGRAALWSGRLMMMPATVMRHPLYQEQLHRLIAHLVELVEAAKVEGDIRSDLPTSVIVRMVVSIFRSNYEEQISGDEPTPAEVSAAIVSVLFDGIRTGRPGL